MPPAYDDNHELREYPPAFAPFSAPPSTRLRAHEACCASAPSAHAAKYLDRRVSELISGGDGIRVLGVDPWI